MSSYRPYLFRLTTFLLLILCATKPIFADDNNLPTIYIPDEFWEYVYLDQNYNVLRDDYQQTQGKLSREILPIYAIRVNKKHVKQKWLDEFKKYNFHGDFYFWDQYFYIYLDPKTPEKIFNKIRRLGFSIVETPFVGTKVLSHNTYFAWIPGEPQSARYLKFNFYSASECAVEFSEALIKNPRIASDPLIAFFPEVAFFNLYLEDEDITFKNLVRAPYAVHMGQPLKAPYYPVHGIFKSGKTDHWAKLMGLAHGEEWVAKEYIPKLAKNMARYNFYYGILHQAHTQNLVVYVDPATGEIITFAIRDLNDAGQIPLISQLNPKAKNIDDSFLGYIKTNANFRVNDAGDAKKRTSIGQIFANYSGQSVFYSSNSPAYHDENIRTFTRHYIAAAIENFNLVLNEIENGESPDWLQISENNSMFHEELSEKGKVFKLSSEVQEHIEQLLQQSIPEYQLPKIIDTVYNEMAAAFSPTIKPYMEEYDQDYLRSVVKSRMTYSTKFVVFQSNGKDLLEEAVSRSKRKNYKFAFNGKGIFVKDLKTGKVVAYAYYFDSNYLNQIENHHHGASRCSRALQH